MEQSPSWAPNRSLVSHESSLQNQCFIDVLTKTPRIIPITSKINPVHNLSSRPSEIHSNITTQLYLDLSSGPLLSSATN